MASANIERRRRRLASGLVALAALALLAGGCRHVQRPDRAADGLFPLDAGRTWVFRVSVGETETVDVITRIVAVRDGEVEIESGATRYTYEIREDGIFRPSVDAYLIRTPIREGAQWPGAHGGSVEVVAVDETVTVPAGTFEGCVRIEEITGDGVQRQRHTFCPGVGPVKLEQWIDGETVAVGELAGFGTGDDDAS